MGVFARMVVYRYEGHTVSEAQALPANTAGATLFVLCRGAEVHALREVFGWDKSTALECTNLDESVRFTGYDGYDFVSLIYAEKTAGEPEQHEVNLFIAKKHFVLVLPELHSPALSRLEEQMCKAAQTADNRRSPLIYLYYSVLHGITADFSEILEQLEDEIEALSEAITRCPHPGQLGEIGRLHKTAYTYKKLLRALSYIGGQILVDENSLLDSGHTRYFRSVDARLLKLYDFAESLYELSSDLRHIYDSKLSGQMNETVNKLAAITLIFGPLTVIAGIYGMNFTHMPELRWAWGYPLALCVMAAVGFATFWLMKRRKWL